MVTGRYHPPYKKVHSHTSTSALSASIFIPERNAQSCPKEAAIDSVVIIYFYLIIATYEDKGMVGRGQ